MGTSALQAPFLLGFWASSKHFSYPSPTHTPHVFILIRGLIEPYVCPQHMAVHIHTGCGVMPPHHAANIP